jgi:hypothetical protein
MDAAIERQITAQSSAAGSRGLVATVLFPPIKVRFALALLLTFFPYGVLYPLDYPAGELVTLCCWIWVFPSRVGWLSLGLAPLIVNATYGYFAFNLFCLLANLSIAWSAMRSSRIHLPDLTWLYKYVRACMFVTLALAALQAVTNQDVWMSIFVNMRLEPGRGAGLKFEPSQLASLLALYLALLRGRMEHVHVSGESLKTHGSLIREGALVMLATVALTRSFSVLIIAVCFAPMLFMQRRNILLAVSGLLTGVLVGVSVLGDRISDAFNTSGGSATDLITESVGSWRNIPDVLILSNIGDFLFFGNPSEVRIKITTLAVQMSPVLAWVQNTFSIFSAAGVTIGAVATAVLFVAGIIVGMRGLSSSRPAQISWLLLYLAAWFFMAKWDPSVWIALGLLPLAHRLPRRERLPIASAQATRLLRGVEVR